MCIHVYMYTHIHVGCIHVYMNAGISAHQCGECEDQRLILDVSLIITQLVLTVPCLCLLTVLELQQAPLESLSLWGKHFIQ